MFACVRALKHSLESEISSRVYPFVDLLGFDLYNIDI